MNRAAATICAMGMVLVGSGKSQVQPPSNPSQQLLKAAQSGTPAQVQQDLKNGANVNVRDSSGRTPLYFAADRVPGDEKNQILKILLAQPTIAVNDAATWGETPLYNASTGCDQFAVQILLYAGADPYLAINNTFSDPNYFGWTPYDTALAQFVSANQAACGPLLSILPSPPGPFHAVESRLELAECPESGYTSFKCYWRLAHVKDGSMPNGDGEIWLSGQIANPAVAYDPNSPCAQTNTCFYPTTATLCEQTGFSGVCGSGFPGYLQETDFTFDLILDTTSFNYVAPILQNNVPFFDGNWVPGALPPPPTWMTYPLPLIHCEAVAFVRSLPAPNPTALPLFHGWRETGNWSIEFDGAPFWIDQAGAEANWARLKNCPTVSILASLVFDNEEGNPPELHPISAIRFISEPGKCPQ